MKFNFIKDLEKKLQEDFKVDFVEANSEPCPSNFSGDVTINCFLLARQLKSNPMQIAQKVQEFLSNHTEVIEAECIKAFVNVTIQEEALFRDTVADEDSLLADSILPKDEQRRILIEFSAPNTNKPQHLGHVRNNTIGMTNASIMRKVGHDVIPVNLVNDRGIHICKSMIAYERFGNGVTPESTGTKGDHLVGEYYVKYNDILKEQLCELRKSQPKLAEKSNDDLFLVTEIGQATQKMLVDWENGDDEVLALWKKMNGWVFAGFAQTYKKMGVEFDHTYLESDTYKLGKDIIKKGLTDGVFSKRDDGAAIIDLDAQKLGEKVVLRSDGTSVYVTQDIGTSLLKYNDYKPDSMIWVVGDEQIYHFKVLFAILKALGFSWANELTHMAYGMVNLPSGKMKSREGTVVDADDLFIELEKLARQATLEKCGANIPENIDERAEVIGMGALKFMLQKFNPKSTIKFDPEAAIKFEGDTGPYVLYAYARISSILRKAGDELLLEDVNWAELGEITEKKLALTCSQYGDVLKKCAANYDSSILANYLLALAKSFSRFYSSCPVLAANSKSLCRARLELSARVRRLLKEGLNALTIGTLESM